MNPAGQGNPGRPVLTLSQRRLLRALRAGYSLERAAKGASSYTLVSPGGIIDGQVYSKTVHALVTAGAARWTMYSDTTGEEVRWHFEITELGLSLADARTREQGGADA